MTFVEAALDIDTFIKTLSPEQKLERRREQLRAANACYRLTEKGRTRTERYEATPKALERKRAYDTSELGRERARRYRDHINLMGTIGPGGKWRHNRRTPGVRPQRPERPIWIEATLMPFVVHGLMTRKEVEHAAAEYQKKYQKKYRQTVRAADGAA